MITTEETDVDVLLARIGQTTDRTAGLVAIELILLEVDRLARRIMDRDETNSFCVHVDASLSVLDEMD